MEKGYKVIGLQQSDGEYEGHAYNNVNIHCTYENDRVAGLAAEKIKVASKIFALTPVKIGERFDVNYDKFGKVKELTVIK